jgi:hypothetical protein
MSTTPRDLRSPEAESYAPGQVVLADVKNPLENPLSIGNARPVVLVRREGDLWRVMGLTTRTHYNNGSRRRPVPNYRAVGLSRPGFLWGDRLTNVSAADLGRVLGRMDDGLARAIIMLARLCDGDASTLLAYAA